ncbi:MAG: peptidoglycan-binding protein [Comamonas sp.]
MKKLALVGLVAMALVGCESTGMKLGGGTNNTTTGGAAGASSQGENSQLQKCDSPVGTVSLVENQQAGWYTILRNEYRLPPTANLLRVLIQQSNCFVVVERSAAGMNAMNRERAMMDNGEMRKGSNFGKGQVVASDYGLSPEVTFSEDNAGGFGAALGALGGRGGRALGGVAAGSKTREASAMLTLVDNRSGVQVSSSTGNASNTDWGGFGALFGGSAGASMGGYSNTSQGKVVSAAFVDAYNQMVIALRNYQTQAVKGQGLGGGGRLTVDGAAPPSQTGAPGAGKNVRMNMKQAQQRLNELGYDVGTPDGAAGPRTQNALRSFQQDQGVPVTGRLDQATMRYLAE